MEQPWIPRIICTATFDVRCRPCQHRETAILQVPVDARFFLEDHVALESFLGARFAPSEGKAIADRLGCERCHASDFEVGFVTRLPAYREGDDMRLPVQVP